MTNISIQKCEMYEYHLIENSLLKAFEDIHINNIIKYGEKVLLKVNMTGPYKPEQAATTHPLVVKALVRIIKALGAFPIIGDGPATLVSPLDITGMKKVSIDEQVPAILFKNFVEVNTNSNLLLNNINYSADVINADKVISVPKLKTHALTLMSGSIKNMFGAVAFEERKRLHKYRDLYDFSKVIVDVFATRIPDLVVMDGIIGMHGIGPVQGQPFNLGVLLVGTDSVFVDSIAANILGYNDKKIDVLTLAENCGFGKISSKKFKNEKLMDFIRADLKLIPVLNEKTRIQFLKMALGQIACNYDLCINCNACAEGCPAGAINNESKITVDNNKCLYCFRCCEICPQGAMKVIRERKLDIL